MTGAERNRVLGWRFYAWSVLVTLTIAGALSVCSGHLEPLLGGMLALLVMLSIFAGADKL